MFGADCRFTGKEAVKTKIRTIKYLSQDELKRLFKAIGSKRDRAIFLVAYRHGLRASEVGMIRMEDVNLAQGRIRIERLKNSLGGEHPLQPDEMRVLKAWLKERQETTSDRSILPYIFLGARGLPIHRQTLNWLIKRYGKKAGIPTDKCHFHVLKHSIATHLLDAGADIRFVQYWIGHKNIMNTVIYAQLSHPAKDKVARRLFSTPDIVGI